MVDFLNQILSDAAVAEARAISARGHHLDALVGDDQGGAMWSGAMWEWLAKDGDDFGFYTEEHPDGPT